MTAAASPSTPTSSPPCAAYSSLFILFVIFVLCLYFVFVFALCWRILLLWPTPPLPFAQRGWPQVLRIPETRQEIREEIHDVLGIVEGGYLEEQRRQLQEVLSHSP